MRTLNIVHKQSFLLLFIGSHVIFPSQLGAVLNTKRAGWTVIDSFEFMLTFELAVFMFALISSMLVKFCYHLERNTFKEVSHNENHETNENNN